MTEESARQGGGEGLAALEAELVGLLREKYRLHWRAREEGDASEASESGRLAELQDEIRAVFDRIRLIDKKYKIPPVSMFD